ncbi:universal stress protein [Bacillus testis]|uniref:universal stress protein n=1 Tax=Bacillus testis TaxID=1622072 RepID=UPI00067F1635|nr:universal stress protein [Bacillus testis]
MFNKILVAIDGSPMSDKALDTALSLAKWQQADLLLVHVGRSVVMPPTMIIPSAENVYDAVRTAGEKILKQAKQKAEEEGFTPSAKYVEGDPAEQIIQLAEQEQADLVVIGSRGLGNIKEMVLGGVSHKVSQHVHCPVLIIK